MTRQTRRAGSGAADERRPQQHPAIKTAFTIKSIGRAEGVTDEV